MKKYLVIMKKHLGVILKFSFIISMIVLYFGAWSIHWQESSNSQVFWKTNRTTAGIGFAIGVISWIFWEIYTTSTTRKLWVIISSFSALLTSTILINGVIGLIGGILATGIMATIFALDHYNILSIGKSI